MKKNIADISTDWLSRAIDILFSSHPKRTSLGFVTGGVLYALFGILLSPNFEKISWLNVKGLTIWHYLIFGLFIMHIPTIIDNFGKKFELPNEVEQTLNLINEAENQGVPLSHIKKMRKDLCRSIVDNIVTSKAEHVKQKPSDE